MTVTPFTAALDAGHVELAALRLLHGMLAALEDTRAASPAAYQRLCDQLLAAA